AQAPGDAAPTVLPPVAASSLMPPQVFAPADFSAADGGPAAGARAGVIAGVGIYLMQPYFQNNPAYTVFTEDQIARPDPATGKINFNKPNKDTLSESADRVAVHSHMEVAPLVWLGYVNDDGFGGRVRWWTFREGTSQTMALPPFSGQIFLGATDAAP